MTICFDGPIQWRGEAYEVGRIGLTDQGYFVLDLLQGDRGGERYFITIPINKYRKTNPTQAAMHDDGEYLTVIDDWGSARRFALPRKVINGVLAEAAAHEIPILTEHD